MPDPTRPAEAAAFARDPLGEDAIALRRADYAGKVPGLAAGALADRRPVLDVVAARHTPGPALPAGRREPARGAVPYAASRPGTQPAAVNRPGV
ncbi:hypothetical protein [Streptomyces sp. NPDC088789]|uniref:hypothetical protein n=1 Tax=Streptomyces sp. NPDC088789 TaxID=3365899 RepID=UPI0037F4893A